MQEWACDEIPIKHPCSVCCLSSGVQLRGTLSGLQKLSAALDPVQASTQQDTTAGGPGPELAHILSSTDRHVAQRIAAGQES